MKRIELLDASSVYGERQVYCLFLPVHLLSLLRSSIFVAIYLRLILIIRKRISAFFISYRLSRFSTIFELLTKKALC